MSAVDKIEGYLDVKVLTPIKTLFLGQAKKISISADSGVIEVLPKHVELKGSIGYGPLIIYKDDLREVLCLLGGVYSIKDDIVTVLAHAAEGVCDIDEGRAQEALERSLKRLEQPGLEVEVERALCAHRRAKARLYAKLIR